MRKLLFRMRRIIRDKSTKLDKILENVGWSWSKVGTVTILSMVALTLSVNIYHSIDDAIKNYKLLAIEEQKLNEVKKQGGELDEELDYYSSLEYKQRYAYDSLNLARGNEELFQVVTEERADYDLELNNPDPILKEEKDLWWEILFDEMQRQVKG